MSKSQRCIIFAFPIDSPTNSEFRIGIAAGFQAFQFPDFLDIGFDLLQQTILILL